MVGITLLNQSLKLRFQGLFININIPLHSSIAAAAAAAAAAKRLGNHRYTTQGVLIDLIHW